MEELVRLIANINIHTSHLSTEKIQDVLTTSKKCKNNTETNVEEWNNVAEILWSHIQTGLEKMDDQLLCATCFFSVLILTDKQDFYVKKIEEIIETEITFKTTEIESSRSLQATSLMYGMFQSSFLTQNTEHSNLTDVINSTFNLLNIMGYEYSKFTFIAFKTMNSFRKICGTDLQKVIFTQENQTKLLNLVNHNWENPITGVRDLIKGIFQTLVTMYDSEGLRTIVEEINGFYWNKAKYLMLSELIEHYKSEVSLISEEWIDGLINSLHKPGLVSAGADMYYAVMKKVYSEDVWCQLFQEKIVTMLKGSSNKAIASFGNYWLLTTLKKFPQLMSDLIEEFNGSRFTDNEFYSILFLMKQGNKLGILERNWKSPGNLPKAEKIISSALEHSTAQVRILAFDILCLSQEKSLPSGIEYMLILDYLRNNINSDCTVLRINMLNSLNIFLTQLHITFRNMTDNSQEDLLNFCKNLQEIIITSLNLNGNYQRKCTNVKMINVTIDCLSHVPTKRKGHVKPASVSLKHFLKSNNSWKFHDESTVIKLISLMNDPSEDIRDNTGKMLLNHYTEELKKPEIMHEISNQAIQCMKSKFFFEISCGQSMFRLIANILVKEKLEGVGFNSIDDIFNYGYSELRLAENLAHEDVLKSIEDGKQLHSFIGVLHVVLESCIKNSHKLDESLKQNMNNLVDALQHIANQFTWEQQNSTSSDFSKMNEMVEDIITKSTCNNGTVTHNDETKISGLHQIVLNCLWLNVKASCDLASLIINYCKDDEEMCEKCLNIITHALETSRHKGVIEGAGTALGCGIQILTSLPESAKTSSLPQTLLRAKLDILIREASKMASITRRGAGLSIMVHRIVSSDMRKGKPLFHYFMKTLLKTCQSTEDVPSSQDIENEMDLPKAIFIHFLTKIVMDSSLASDMMFYSAELAELAFSNLTSSHWQIRNAALQLYGALIPRLIGQKKASGTDDETIATVACDELRTHSPKLWTFIMEQLKNKSHSSQIIAHSDLVPILNLLASCAKRYNFSSDLQKTRLLDKELLNSLIKILNSPIHTVRRLTARCIFNIFSLEDICGALTKVDFRSENFVHGTLMLMKCCHKYYNLKDLHDSTAKSFKDICKNVLANKEHCSYCSKEIYVSIHSEQEIISSSETISNNVLAELTENNNSPGVFKWAQTCIEINLMHSTWDDIPNILSLLLNWNDFESYGEKLLCKIENGTCDSELALKQIANILLSYDKKYQSSVVWKILYKIACHLNLENVDVSAILNHFEGRDISYNLRYIIPFAAKWFMNIDEANQKKLADMICKMSDFENTDVDMRHIAALANNELPKFFDKVSDSVKVASLTTAIVLLQDEDEDVRNVCVYYYKNISNQEIPVHPNICLKRMLEHDFLSSIFCEALSIVELCKGLLQLLSSNAHANTDKYNPFANDSKNIYLEVDVMTKIIENIMHTTMNKKVH